VVLHDLATLMSVGLQGLATLPVFASYGDLLPSE
jgi:hypothetical protein